jgi:hypothetical protein
VKLFIFVSFLILACNVYGQEGHFTFSPSLGWSSLHINEQYSLRNNTNDRAKTANLTLLGGYEFDNGLLLEGGHVFSASPNLFGLVDDYDIDENLLQVGYVFKAGNYRLIPKAGYTKWKLDTTEGRFLNFDERKNNDYKGDDPFWAFSAERFFTNKLGLFLSVRQTNYRFGQVYSGDFGIKIAF